MQRRETRLCGGVSCADGDRQTDHHLHQPDRTTEPALQENTQTEIPAGPAAHQDRHQSAAGPRRQHPRLDGVAAIQQDPPLAGNAKGERSGDVHSEADSGAQRTEEDGQDRGGTADRRRPAGAYSETEGGGSYRGVECFFCVEPQSV